MACGDIVCFCISNLAVKDFVVTMKHLGATHESFCFQPQNEMGGHFLHVDTSFIMKFAPFYFPVISAATFFRAKGECTGGPEPWNGD